MYDVLKIWLVNVKNLFGTFMMLWPISRLSWRRSSLYYCTHNVMVITMTMPVKEAKKVLRIGWLSRDNNEFRPNVISRKIFYAYLLTYCTFTCVYFLLLCTQLSATYLDSFELRVRLKRWISVNGLLSHLDLIWKLRYRKLKNSQNANFLIWNYKGKYYISCMDWISATKIHIYEYRNLVLLTLCLWNAYLFCRWKKKYGLYDD
jgi:hypothetical protein